MKSSDTSNSTTTKYIIPNYVSTQDAAFAINILSNMIKCDRHYNILERELEISLGFHQRSVEAEEELPVPDPDPNSGTEFVTIPPAPIDMESVDDILK